MFIWVKHSSCVPKAHSAPGPVTRESRPGGLRTSRSPSSLLGFLAFAIYVVFHCPSLPAPLPLFLQSHKCTCSVHSETMNFVVWVLPSSPSSITSVWVWVWVYVDLSGVCVCEHAHVLTLACTHHSTVWRKEDLGVNPHLLSCLQHW